MLLVKIFGFILICGVVRGRLKEVETNHEKASNYVRKVLEDLNLQNSATHDVVLLRISAKKFMKKKADEIYAAMHKAIPKENPVMTPHLVKKAKTKNIRKAAVVIIVSDVYDAVSYFFSSLNRKFVV